MSNVKRNKIYRFIIFIQMRESYLFTYINKKQHSKKENTAKWWMISKGKKKSKQVLFDYSPLSLLMKWKIGQHRRELLRYLPRFEGNGTKRLHSAPRSEFINAGLLISQCFVLVKRSNLNTLRLRNDLFNLLQYSARIGLLCRFLLTWHLTKDLRVV